MKIINRIIGIIIYAIVVIILSFVLTKGLCILGVTNKDNAQLLFFTILICFPFGEFLGWLIKKRK